VIVTESYELNGIAMTKTYSNIHHYVERYGVKYEEAHDPARLGRTYTESGDEIVVEFEDELAETKAALNVLGVKP
jgi:hypothetical protein